MTAKDDRRSDEWWDEGASGDDDVREKSHVTHLWSGYKMGRKVRHWAGVPYQKPAYRCLATRRLAYILLLRGSLYPHHGSESKVLPTTRAKGESWFVLILFLFLI
jgi:hypothetical protein